MIIYPCFEGDVDRALAGVQHDLYFAYPERPPVSMAGTSTLGWIWRQAVYRAEARRHLVSWIDRNLDRIKRIDHFNHKLLQIPHEHMAAYFRWTMPRIERPSVYDWTSPEYPMDLLDAWRGFLEKDIPNLLSSDRALETLARSMVYQSFDRGDEAYREFQDILMRRYGRACVELTWWADEVAGRLGIEPGSEVHSTLESSRQSAESQESILSTGGKDMDEGDTWGCLRCWPEFPDAAFDAGVQLEVRKTLVHDSHFHVKIVSCSNCGQSYVWVFSELIDWKSSDDSQGWIRMPLAAEDQEYLARLPTGEVESALQDLDETRVSLWRMHPRGGDTWCAWRQGIPQLPHD